MELETEEMSMGLGLGVYTCNPGAWEVEAEGRFKVSQAYVVRPETLPYGGGGIYIYGMIMVIPFPFLPFTLLNQPKLRAYPAICGEVLRHPLE